MEPPTLLPNLNPVALVCIFNHRSGSQAIVTIAECEVTP